MIAKHVPMRTVKKSDFSELARYITDDQNKNERVGKVSYTNCSADNLDGVIAEVLATQHQNKRAESDKTYHLIVSFPAGEHPSSDILQVIESRICKGLGFDEHQRMSVVHTDTDNLHLHIAINKIHPERGTIHDPYNDHKTLGRLCEKLEMEYGLTPVNHKVQKRGAENRAADMEHHAGVESLLGWIKRECYAELKNAGSWHELHQVMAENSLELKERGNGFVVVAQDGTMVKASSIDRDFSKSKLERRFGVFEPSPFQVDEAPTKQYKAKPMRSRVDTEELYAQYQKEQGSLRALRSKAWTKAKDRKNDLIEAAKKKGRAKRAAVKLLSGSISKRILYSAISKSVKKEIDSINKQYGSDRQNIYEQHQSQAWADWLRTKASTGNEEALKALRARESSRGVKGNVVSGTRDYQHVGSNVDAKQDSVTKQGTVIYQNGIRDDGRQLKVSKIATKQELKEALLMAMDRYGQRIAVKGTDDFIEQILQIAVHSKLTIEFDNAELERRRQELLSQTTQEKSDVRWERVKTGEPGRGASNYGSNGDDGLGSTRNRNHRPESRGINERGRSAGTGGRLPKPDVGKIGQNPPPFRRNGLRGLSSIVMAGNRSEGSTVLLPGNVPGRVEQQGEKEDIRLRRTISGSATIDSVWVAADKYIQEREEKRAKIFDIMKHSRYNEDISGAYAFAGIRQIEGQALALLQLKDEVFVLPIDKAAVNRLRRISIGDQVAVEKGTIKTKGRSR
ncbi:MAG: relaxase/mobilization nuclease domain-containing protein [Methylococcales bacterium]|nr:relaxase/mobilization nuclease domain-containing protein [Methylococcales bacterium]